MKGLEQSPDGFAFCFIVTGSSRRIDLLLASACAPPACLLQVSSFSSARVSLLCVALFAVPLRFLRLLQNITTSSVRRECIPDTWPVMSFLLSAAIMQRRVIILICTDVKSERHHGDMRPCELNYEHRIGVMLSACAQSGRFPSICRLSD